MTRSRKTLGAVAAVAVAGLIAWPVYAHCGKCVLSAKAMVKQIEQTDFTLEKAVKLAEKHTNGKALAAFSHTRSETVGMKVFCLANEKIIAVKVDPQSAKVIGTKETNTLPIPTDHEHERED